MNESVFTTGQVAKICEVAPATAAKWFDSGLLVGYRVPGSRDRRIPRENLIKFLKEHGMPTDKLNDRDYRDVAKSHPNLLEDARLAAQALHDDGTVTAEERIISLESLVDHVDVLIDDLLSTEKRQGRLRKYVEHP